MNRLKIKISPEAIADIQYITDWYNEQKAGLGKRFQYKVIRQINSLSENPFVYGIRYNEIRCMSIKQFPYMVHFSINEEEKTVEILAVISTDRSPEIWMKK